MACAIKTVLQALKYIKMNEPLLFVPFGINNVFSLYKVLFTDDYSRLNWSMRMSGESPIIGEKLKNLKKYFRKEIGGRFEGRSTKDKSDFKELNESTPSVFLGLFLAAFCKMEHRKFKSYWTSIIVTGDLDYNPITGEMKLVPVVDIEKKYQAAADYASKHDGEHLFVYVSDEKDIEPDIDKNLSVKVFAGGYSVGAIIAEVFEPRFDEEQIRLFEKCNVSLPFDTDNMNLRWEYISTPAFEMMKQEALLPGWKGFLIHGEGESGKSAMALELALYLAAAEKIYTPIWVSIENKKLQQYIEKQEKVIGKPFEKQDPLIENSYAAYIAKAIVKTLNANPDTGEDLSRLADIINMENAAPYLLVIDNLELDRVIEVMNAVQIILGGVKNKPPVIITSRFDEKEAGYAQKMGLKNKPQDKAALSSYEVEFIVYTVSRGEVYEKKIDDNLESTEYQTFISSLFQHFSSFPGIITHIVPQLAYREFSELNPILLSMKDMQFQEKINTVYKGIFSQLDDFTQAVLFAFIGTIARETLENNIDDIQADTQEMAEAIFCSEWNFQDDTFLELPEIEEKIPNALIELARSHLIYQTTQNNSSNKAGFSMKTLPYTTFMFEEAFEGKTLNGKSLRDILLDNPPDIIGEALRYNQPVSRLKKYLERMRNEDKNWFKYAFLCVASCFSNKPEHINLLLEFGYEINQKWTREKSRNPVQCAALYNNNPSILQRLIDKGADYKSRDDHSWTPLHCAAANNSNPAVIAILIDNKADLKSRDYIGATALHLAAIGNSNPEVAAMLIDKGLDMYAKDKEKKTPLEYAVLNPNKAVIEMFYKKEAKLDTVFSDNMTLLHYAARHKKLDIAEWLIDKGLNIHAATKDGFTPLHVAALVDNNTEMISLLLERGAISDINSFVDVEPPWYNVTINFPPLHLAAVTNKTSDNVDLLVKKGAKIDLKDREGSIPLHLAASINEEPAMINILLNHDADINAKNAEGKTPVYMAAFNKNPQVAIALIKAGAKLDDEVQYKGNSSIKKKDTALKRLKKRKDWPLIEAAIKA